MKYDVETLEADLLALMKAKLPAKVAEINAEKADTITLTAFTDAQYFNTTDDRAAVSNQKINCMYGVVDGSAVSVSGSTAKTNRYIFLVYLNELNKTQGSTRKKLLRYTRAFEEIFEENFDRIPCGSNIEIQSISPQSWAENEKSPVYKVAGVYIEISLAS